MANMWRNRNQDSNWGSNFARQEFFSVDYATINYNNGVSMQHIKTKQVYKTHLNSTQNFDKVRSYKAQRTAQFKPSD